MRFNRLISQQACHQADSYHNAGVVPGWAPAATLPIAGQICHCTWAMLSYSWGSTHRPKVGCYLIVGLFALLAGEYEQQPC